MVIAKTLCHTMTKDCEYPRVQNLKQNGWLFLYGIASFPTQVWALFSGKHTKAGQTLNNRMLQIYAQRLSCMPLRLEDNIIRTVEDVEEVQASSVSKGFDVVAKGVSKVVKMGFETVSSDISQVKEGVMDGVGLITGGGKTYEEHVHHDFTSAVSLNEDDSLSDVSTNDFQNKVSAALK